MKYTGYYLNLWDDFNEDDPKGTFVQLEFHNLTLDEQRQVMEHFLPLFKELENDKRKIEIYLYDTYALYPNMDEEKCRNTGFHHYQTWKIRIPDIDYETVEGFVEKHKKTPLNYKDKEVRLISES